MNNLDLIDDALSLINVLPEGQTASPEQSEVALRELNSLVDEWADDEIIVNWSSQAALADECSLSGIELSAAKYVLAVKLCPHFGRDPSPAIVALANNSFAKLQRIQLVRSIEAVELSLPAAEGGGYGYDITKG